MIKMSFMQLIKSPATYLSVAGVTLIGFISVQPYFSADDKGASVLYYFSLLLDLSMSKKLITLCAALPGVVLFCNDWSCQYIKPVVIRSGVKRYAFSRCLACFLSAFALSFLGMAVFVFLLSLKLPLMDINFVDGTFAPLADSPLPALYILAHIFVFSLAMALWAMVGLAVSAYIPNRFVAVTTPIVASYLIEELMSFLPPFLDTYYLTRASNVLGQGAAVSFVYFLFFFLAFSMLLGIVFYFRIRGRMRNEVI